MEPGMPPSSPRPAAPPLKRPATLPRAHTPKGAASLAPASEAPPKTLRQYLERIRRRPDECRVVSRQIDPQHFQVTALLEHLDRRKQYPAVLFERPLNLHGEPSAFPLVANLWATRER